jgi:predicted small lipoprotein YifL
MNPVPHRALRLALALSLATALAGCGDKAPPEPMPAAEVPKALNDAFGKASAEDQSLAKAAQQAVQKDEQAVALELLQALANKADLTPEQREIAARSALSVRSKLLDAANKGDKAAQDYLEQQRARK